MLTWAEADLFLRAGDDMRWAEWPEGDFIRLTTIDAELEGFTSFIYTPTQEELTGNKWRRA